MKIYIVACGEHDSVVDIYGVYLSKEKAEIACALRNGHLWDEYRVEEYDTGDDAVKNTPTNMGRVFNEQKLMRAIIDPIRFYDEGYLATDACDRDIGCIFVPETNPKKAFNAALKICSDKVAKLKAYKEERGYKW